MSRRLKDGVLKAFIKLTENTEIPSIFSLWTGILTVATALGRDCFIDYGHVDIFPNLYIVLVAGSATCRKSSAIAVSRRFIDGIFPKIQILSQKLTPEALIGALSGLTSDEDSTMLINSAEGVFIIDELSTLIDKNAFSSGLIPVLTKLYDGDDFSYQTRGRGLEVIRNPCLSILGGSTSEWIKESIPVVAIGGGFTSRVVFVFREKPDKLVPWPERNEDNIKREADIKHDLNDIAKMRGSFALDADAKANFVTEYKRFVKESPMLNEPNTAGYAGRRHVTLLKVAMAVSASMNDNRVIKLADINVATKAMLAVEADMTKVMWAIRKGFVGTVCEEVLNMIVQEKVIMRSKIVKAMSYCLSSRELDVVIDTLIESGSVRVEHEGGRTKYIYVT